MNKIFKPKSCIECPVFKRKKQKFWCSVQPTSKNEKNKTTIEEMYKRCPIDWDKEKKDKEKNKC